MRKFHDDPHEVDEIILHVQKSDGTDDDELVRGLGERMFNHTEIHPNRIEFHDIETMRQLQGVGVLMKELKVVDHRPKTNGSESNGVAATTASAGNGSNGRNKPVTVPVESALQPHPRS